MMNAVQARKKAESFKTLNYSVILGKLDAEITKACEKGEFEVYFYEPLPEEVCTELKRLGFDVSSSFHFNEVTYTIKW